MTDLEITKLCAEAMGLEVEGDYCNGLMVIGYGGHPHFIFDPLHDDAQAMALVKKFRLAIGEDKEGWYLVMPDYPAQEVHSADLNRAICECVAKMQQAK